MIMLIHPIFEADLETVAVFDRAGFDSVQTLIATLAQTKCALDTESGNIVIDFETSLA